VKLVDVRRRLVLEADSFARHGSRQALRWDAQRYHNLVVRVWLVLRFAWEDVMHDQDYVRRTLHAVSELVDRPARPSRPAR
jgi:very-short-patch-repair endonuclease